MVILGLDPWVTGEVNRATCKAFYGDVFKEELFLVFVSHRDGSRRSKCGIYRELRRVMDFLRFWVRFLWPVFQYRRFTLLRLIRFYFIEIYLEKNN